MRPFRFGSAVAVLKYSALGPSRGGTTTRARRDLRHSAPAPMAARTASPAPASAPAARDPDALGAPALGKGDDAPRVPGAPSGAGEPAPDDAGSDDAGARSPPTPSARSPPRCSPNAAASSSPPSSPGTPDEPHGDVRDHRDDDDARGRHLGAASSRAGGKLPEPDDRLLRRRPRDDSPPGGPAASGDAPHDAASAPPRLTRAHWVPDRDAPRCANRRCGAEFRPLVRRRHHCRACGEVFCARCCATRMLLDAETAEPVPTRGANAVDARVCLGCYEKAMARRQQKSGDEKRRAEGKSSMTEPGRTETETETEIEAAAATSGGDGETSGGDAATSDGGDATTSDGGDAAMSDGSAAAMSDGSAAATSDGSATRDFDASEAPRDGSAAGSSARQRSASGSFAPAAPPSSSPPSFGPAGPVPAPVASSPTAASLARLARTSALLLAETPSTPDGLASASGARLSGLVARYSSQLREHRRVADDAVGALDAERAAHAATERALALARAQLTRNGALWEELTEARAALERERRRARKRAGAEGGLRPTPVKNATGANGIRSADGGGQSGAVHSDDDDAEHHPEGSGGAAVGFGFGFGSGGGSKVGSKVGAKRGPAAAAAKPLLARVTARWVSENPTSKATEKTPETSTTTPVASANEEPFRPCVAWLDVPGWNSASRAEGASRRFSDASSRRSSSSGPATSFRGGSLLVRDERTGAALAGGGSVRFADVRSCSATFDEATGHAGFRAEVAPAGGADGRRLEVRVDGAVAARRWALEIERRAREAREGETSSKGA